MINEDFNEENIIKAKEKVAKFTGLTVKEIGLDPVENFDTKPHLYKANIKIIEIAKLINSKQNKNLDETEKYKESFKILADEIEQDANEFEIDTIIIDNKVVDIHTQSNIIKDFVENMDRMVDANTNYELNKIISNLIVKEEKEIEETKNITNENAIVKEEKEIEETKNITNENAIVKEEKEIEETKNITDKKVEEVVIEKKETIEKKQIEVFVDTTTNLVWQDNYDSNTVTYTFEEANKYCEDLNISKYTEWRLPNIKELFSIVDIENSTTNENLIHTKSASYWSSSKYPLDNYLIIGINFNDGSDGITQPTKSYYTRCVTGSTLPKLSFEKDNNTVIDELNNLTWQDNEDINNTFSTYEDATQYCNSLTTQDSIWRVPSIKELHSIVNINNQAPSIYKTFKHTLNSFFWSSTPYILEDEKVWTIFFTDGNDYKHLKTDKAYIRCVKDTY